nr:hypothetical protein Q903MT_gene1136 [Picea sitchensis]
MMQQGSSQICLSLSCLQKISVSPCQSDRPPLKVVPYSPSPPLVFPPPLFPFLIPPSVVFLRLGPSKVPPPLSAGRRTLPCT